MKKSIFILLVISSVMANAQIIAQKSIDRLTMNGTPNEKLGSSKSESNYTTTAPQDNTFTKNLQPNATEKYVGMLGCDVGDFYLLANVTLSEFNKIHEPKKSDDELSSLAYSDSVMPLVNAVKEQQTQINALLNLNEVLAKRVAALEVSNVPSQIKTSKNIHEVLPKKVPSLEDLKAPIYDFDACIK